MNRSQWPLHRQRWAQALESAAESRPALRDWVQQQLQRDFPSVASPGPAQGPTRSAWAQAECMAQWRQALLPASAAPTGDPAPTPLARPNRRRTPPGLRSVQAHEGLWSRVRLEQRLREALQQVPQNPGPLNPQGVLSRVLHALDEASPSHLQHWVDHLDALAALDALRTGTAPKPRKRQPASPPRSRLR